MRLPDFISANIEPIVLEWVTFARTRMPAAASMSELALRDDAATILSEVIVDMGGLQSIEQQRDKSQELYTAVPKIAGAPASHRHAQQRAASGFDAVQLVSEFRALRATVLRLWAASAYAFDDHDLEDVTRFNEAIDQMLAGSLKVFVEEDEHRRHLFMGVLGHDLRGPLHTIMSCAQLTLRKLPQGAREAGMILRSATQIKTLADDLLEFTISGLNIGTPIAATAMQFGQFCRQTIEEISTISPGRVIDLRVEGDTSGAWDGRRLHQLIWNLIINALKYGETNDAVSVIVDGTQPDGVQLVVHNFGTPIPPAVLPHLFAPLVRGSVEDVASPISAGANMGLGLYIVNSIVTAHAGSITVTSTAEDGTRFAVRLPRRSH